MIKPGKRIGARGTDGIRGRIVKIIVQAGSVYVFVVYGAAESKYLPVGQHDATHLDARLGHVRAKGPGWRCGGKINGFGSVGGRATASENDHFRGVTVRWSERKQYRCAVSAAATVFSIPNGGPCSGGWSEEP